MTEEEKAELAAKAAEEAEAKAKADAEAQDDETTEDEEKQDDSKSAEESKQLELEAELKKEREAREKAEKASADLAFKLREKKRNQDNQEDEGDDLEDEDKPLTAKQLSTLLAKERETTRKEMQSAEADRIASKVSTNDTEKQLILEIHKNRSFPTHLSLEEQFEECYAIANRKKLIGERDEALRALKGKQGVSRNAATTHHDAPTGSAPKIAGVDAAELARVGFKFNTVAKRWEKKLPNGSLLVKKDLKSPSTVVQV